MDSSQTQYQEAAEELHSTGDAPSHETLTTRKRHHSDTLSNISVKGIRKFFIKAANKKSSRKTEQTRNKGIRKGVNFKQGAITSPVNVIPSLSQTAKEIYSIKGDKTPVLRQLNLTPTTAAASHFELASKEVINTLHPVFFPQTDKEVSHIKDIGAVAKQITSQPKPATEKNSKMETEADTALLPNPKTVTLEMVYAMFQRLEQKVDALSQRQISEEKEKEVCESALQHVDSILDPVVAENKNLKGEILHIKQQNRVLTDVVTKLSENIVDIQQKIEGLDIVNAKKCATISNFYTGKDKQERLDDLYNFFLDYLQVEIGIDEVAAINDNNPPTLLLTFQTIEDKRLLFNQKGLLRNFKNKDGTKIYINQYTPAATNEKKRREQDIFTANKHMGKEQLSMEFVRGNLQIQGSTYKKRVLPPTPNELINITPSDLSYIMSLSIGQGDNIMQDGNIFKGYTAPVSNYTEIRNLYIKMKLCFPSAKHIVCAYYIPGKELHYNCDYSDDGEYGAGRQILKVMTDSNLISRVIFVTRMAGSVKMGPARHECYMEAAKSAVIKNGYNTKTRTHQQVVPRERTSKKAQNTQVQGGRPKLPYKVNQHQFTGGSTPKKLGQPSTPGRKDPPYMGVTTQRRRTGYHPTQQHSSSPLTETKTYAAAAGSPPQFHFSKPHTATDRLHDVVD